MFVNAQEMKKQYPNTFEAPTTKELNALKKGDIVKVCYNDQERFWVILTSVRGQKLKGKVDNILLTPDLSLGDTIEFEKKNVYDIINE